MSNSFVTPWIVAHQALLSMGFPKKEYWSALPFSSPGDLPDLGIEPASPVLQEACLQLSHEFVSLLFFSFSHLFLLVGG